MELQVMPAGDGLQRDEVEGLLAEATAHDGHAALGEHKWLDLVHGGRREFAGILARLPEHPHPVGYAHLSRHERQWGLEIVVHPQHRGVGVELALVRRALEVAAEQGGGHLHLWVFRPTEIHEGLAHTLGLRKGRDLLHMRVRLPVPAGAGLPEGVELRPFRPGRDEQAWLEINNRAFGHHPEQGTWDADTLRRRMAEDWFDPDGFLLAWDGDDLVGFCWVKPQRGHRTGEIYVVGVDPGHQGRKLGKPLVVAGLSWMHEQRFEAATLYVDAENDAAVKLYRSLGFDVHHLDRAYVTDVEGT